ncbi:MAG: polysaccharide deacetylase family protein [Desulfobacteraceae bacterium]|nr:MAG: polysaccharide deacetylase family protein [Desulfobacteraceae bacterium]
MFGCSLSRIPVDYISKLLNFIIIMIFFVVSTPLCFYSCAPTGAVIKPEEHNLFRSEDYIIYLLPEAEPPADLAEKFLGDKKKSWVIEETNPDVPFKRGDSVVIPMKNRNKGGLSAEGFQTIPILAYHRFAEDCTSPLCTPARIFEFQMRYLKENGYHVVTPEELLAFLEYRQGLPKKSVLITMDDGYRSAYNIAYPILKKNGFTATLFIYTSFVGVSKMAITWDQLQEMQEDGFTIGSHTIYHSDLTRPKEGETEHEFIARINEELHGSKKIIDQKLRQNTCFLAYPFGYYDQRSVKIAREAGYKMAVSVKRGGNPFFANPLSLRRDQILERDKKIFISRLKTFNFMSLR